jgi:hypothetical protein
MPYIKKENRDALVGLTSAIKSVRLNTPGELNFVISTICNSYLNSNNLNYQTINDIVGALEGAKLEFYRQVVAPYEDGKIKLNGDVYDWLSL